MATGENDLPLTAQLIMPPVNAAAFIFHPDGSFTYLPVAGYSGSDSFVYQTLDSQGHASAPATVTITILPVNDPPVHSVPGPQTVGEDASLTFSSGGGNGISVTDADAGASTLAVTLGVTQGHLTLAGTTGLALLLGDGTADRSMRFSGSLSSINAALTGLVYTPNGNFHGVDLLSISSDDQGASGSGGPASNTNSVLLVVTALNDPPAANGDVATWPRIAGRTRSPSWPTTPVPRTAANRSRSPPSRKGPTAPSRSPAAAPR